jgi:ABC-type uncharacterized transport system auxiliary subunit
MFHLKKITILIVGIFLLHPSACLNLKQPGNIVEYYTLEYDPPSHTGMDKLPYAVRVERFTVAPTYDTTQIIYREKSFTRNAYVYHKWRVNPGDMVTHFLSRDIRSSGLFKAVIPHKSRSKSSFTLEGDVEEFFEWDTRDQWDAVITINIHLVAENELDLDDRIIFQKRYHATEACKRKHPASLADAIGLALSRISKEIIKDAHNYLSN